MKKCAVFCQDEVCMHLTNYAINKNSEDFVRDDKEGSKRKLAAVCDWLTKNGYDVKRMWSNIEVRIYFFCHSALLIWVCLRQLPINRLFTRSQDVIIKTLISAHPILKHNYKTCFPNHIRGSACFEILGFDVMLDKKMKAWILEVSQLGAS